MTSRARGRRPQVAARLHARRRVDGGRRRRRALRSVGRGQDPHAPVPGRAHAPRRRPHRGGRPRALRRGGRRRRAAAAAARRLRLPGLRALPAPHRARQRRLRPPRPRPGRAASPGGRGAGAAGPRGASRSATRASSRAASASASPSGARSPPIPALLLLDEPLSALDLPLRQALRDELRSILAGWGTAAVLVTHDLTEAYRLGDRIVVYEDGRVIQAAPRAELLWQPSSRSVARIMGIRNVLQGVTLKATPDRIQFRWRGQILEAVNSPTRSYLPAPDSPLAFFIRPEYVRLIRKDRGRRGPGSHHMNLMAGTVVREVDLGTTWTLYIRLDEPGAPAQGDYDLELEVPRLVYEILEIDRDRHWQFSHAPRLDPRAAVRLMTPLPVVALHGVRVSRAGRAILDDARARGGRGRGPRGHRPQRRGQVHPAPRDGPARAARPRAACASRASRVTPGAGPRGAAAHGQRLPGAAPRRHHGPRQRGHGPPLPRRGARPRRAAGGRAGSRGSASRLWRPARRARSRAARRSATALARALVLEPELLLLDEPFSALDQPTREALIDDLGRILRQERITTVLVTHDRGEAMALGDRVGVLMGGRLRPARRHGPGLPRARLRGGRALRGRGDHPRRAACVEWIAGRWPVVEAGGQTRRGGAAGRAGRAGAALPPAGGRDALARLPPSPARRAVNRLSGTVQRLVPGRAPCARHR